MRISRNGPDGHLVFRALSILPARDRKYLFVVVALQAFLGVLDLIGVLVIGILGALAISGVSTGQPGNRVQIALEFLGIGSSSLQVQAAILGAIATIILVSKTLISVYFSRKISFFLSRRSAAMTSRLLSKVLNQDFSAIRTNTMQQTLYSVTAGVEAIMLGIVGTSVSLVSDLSLLIILGSGLVIVDSAIAFFTFLMFSSVAILMYKLLHKKSKSIGENEAKYVVELNERIIEILASYRELVVRNRRNYYWKNISHLRFSLADTLAEKNFMPSITKYILEIVLVIGALVLGAYQFSVTDAVHAVAILSIFLAASTRISPAILRMQQAFIIMKGSTGAASPTLELIEKLESIEPLEDSHESEEFSRDGFFGNISLEKIKYRYPNSESDALIDISLEIHEGELIAIVGPSGAGKSTLADVILGLLPVAGGKVTISGLAPGEVIRKWPGIFGYVPQDVLITNGTVRENVALGFDPNEFPDKQIWDVLEVTSLEETVAGLPKKLDTKLGDRGGFISGGQRQRLGIARALFTKPGIIVLDEATSALDGETEADISNAISALKGKVTVLLIAHRLSTVRNADRIYYLDRGHLVASGNFEQLRKLVPDFDSQASLMGL